MTISSHDFTQATDPYEIFAAWMKEAEKKERTDPNAMSLATVDADGMPNVRIVLLKDFDENGFVFYTNYESMKGQEILGAQKAAIAFHWKSLQRQVRARGIVEQVSAKEADEYFATRPRLSRIGAWASQQSRPLSDRAALKQEVAKYEAEFPNEDIPRPEHWSGFRIKPISIEFWHGRAYRLHDRVRFERDGDTWSRTRLYP